jgi:hypothetical protein
MELPAALDWSLHRGETGPILGWYSAELGRRVPSWTLLGSAAAAPGHKLVTHLSFTDSGNLSGDVGI